MTNFVATNYNAIKEGPLRIPIVNSTEHPTPQGERLNLPFHS